MEAGQSLFDCIRNETESFTKSERKVARVLLADYPAAGLQTVAELASRSAVSGQTVIRFVARLGFESYPAFQQHLIGEVKARSQTPLSRFEGQELPPGDHPAAAAFSVLEDGLRETLSRLPLAEFDRAVELLSDQKHPLVAVGGRTSQLVAHYLVLQLQQLRPRTAFVPEDALARTRALMEMGRNTLAVVYDFRRYSESTRRFASAAAKAGATVLLITDPYLSPVAEVADIVLPVRIEFPTPFDSQTAAVALSEALVAAVTDRMDGSFADHMARYEKFRSQLSGDTGATG